MLLLTKKTKYHFIKWRLKKYSYVDYQALPKVCQVALIFEFFAINGIFTGLENRMNEYWLETDDSYGYGKRNYMSYDNIRGIDRLTKIANIIYNKKHGQK